ncbi:MAG: ribosome small subunit-dependent GTPase A [Clostridium sp.]|nr:ribosome small subunit-dependent GTPase A [Clostridium sp.]
MQGIIVKGIAGFYYVKIEDKIYECKARGRFRHNSFSPLVGDKAIIEVENDKGFILDILPRTSELVRPAIANVSQAIIVFAVKNPQYNGDLLNKFLVLSESNNINVIVCFNKIDLISEEELKKMISSVENMGYKVICLNAKNKEGFKSIRENLKDNITVLCGPSGVGKSTILNGVIGKDKMETGTLSEKLQRGKQTTRHVELIETDGGYLADSPGFSSLELLNIEKEDLQYCFPEFKAYYNTCKFSTCMHHKEPGCAVKKAVDENLISKDRYDFYIKTLEEISNRRKWK